MGQSRYTHAQYLSDLFCTFTYIGPKFYLFSLLKRSVPTINDQEGISDEAFLKRGKNDCPLTRPFKKRKGKGKKRLLNQVRKAYYNITKGKRTFFIGCLSDLTSPPKKYMIVRKCITSFFTATLTLRKHVRRKEDFCHSNTCVMHKGNHQIEP